MDIALEVRTDTRPGTVIVSAAGEVDLSNLTQLRQAGIAALEQAAPGELLVLDLSGLTFMDSSGLGVTVQVLKAAQRKELQVAVVVEHPLLVRLFTITGVVKAFPVSTSLATVLAVA